MITGFLRWTTCVNFQRRINMEKTITIELYPAVDILKRAWRPIYRATVDTKAFLEDYFNIDLTI